MSRPADAETVRAAPLLLTPNGIPPGWYVTFEQVGELQVPVIAKGDPKDMAAKLALAARWIGEAITDENLPFVTREALSYSLARIERCAAAAAKAGA